MIDASDNARLHWSASKDSINRYGGEAASDFSVLDGVRSSLIDAFDLLSEKSNSVTHSQNAAYSFDILWAMLNSERQQVLKRIEQDRS